MDGRCGWCGQPLTEGEIFTIELEVAAWEQGERLFAPEHPALERRDELIPSCQACRDSITTNYDQWVKEQSTKSAYDRISCTAMVVIFTTFYLAIVLKAFSLI
jgi:hypothetical protein